MRAAMDVLERSGLAAVSTRAVADRLGVRMNTVLWHVGNKATLVNLMADRVVAAVGLDGLPGEGRARARELVRRYRRALLDVRDGAVLVTGTFVAEPGTLRFAEALTGALVAGGLDDREAAWTCWSVVYFTLGLTAEEQASAGADADDLRSALDPEDHPVLTRALPHLAHGSFDERFAHGLALLIPDGGRAVDR